MRWKMKLGCHCGCGFVKVNAAAAGEKSASPAYTDEDKVSPLLLMKHLSHKTA